MSTPYPPTCKRKVRRAVRTLDDPAGDMVFTTGPEEWCGGSIFDGVCDTCGRPPIARH